MKKSTELTTELLNAHGPYDHAIWDPKNRGGTPHHKLSRFVIETIAAQLKDRYSKSQLGEMSILDVGGYDGWILVQLQSEFNFKHAVCVEPRLKNIQKGEFARSYYQINTTVNFLQGELDSLGSILKNKFDFVLCLNVLHHVDSTPRAIKSITDFCDKTIFISSAIIEKPKTSRNKVKKLMNLKDISYLSSPGDFATAGFKFESPYFDGSTTESTIVNLPEKKLIEMSLTANGFESNKKISNLNSKEVHFFTKHHGELWVLVVATKNLSSVTPEEKYLEDRIKYETNFLFTILTMPILRLWIRRLNPHSKTLKRFRFIDFLQNLSWNILIKCFASRDNEFGISRMIIRLAKLQSHEVSIIQNISKAPVEKSCFELAKHFLREGKCNEAKILFKSMTSKPDCDWRVFYRSCYFLTVIAQIENDSGSLAHYKMLLKIANPHFQFTTEEGVKWVSRET